MNLTRLRQLTRRTSLQVGGLSALGLSLPTLLQQRDSAIAAESQPRPKSCILLYMTGGPAQQETFDMKPEATGAPRGEFDPIASNVPGIDVCELMPRTAQCADMLTVVRSVYHDQTFHGAGCHYNLTGFPHTPREPVPEFYLDRRDAPSIGSVVGRLRNSRNGLPSSVHLPFWIQQGNVGRFAGQHAGFMGPDADCARIFYEEKDNLPGKLPSEYRLAKEISSSRFDRRMALINRLEQPALNRSQLKLEKYQFQAADILNAGGAWRAFSIEDEKPETIERYGNHKFGRSCLVARRLVEAGVNLVTVNWPGHEFVHFDTHAGHFPDMKDKLLPPSDTAFSALLEDLRQRGMLDNTLVVWTGEFGRTPALNGNKSAGRDHWPFVYTTVLVGGGVKGGKVYGKSDNIAAYPQDDPVHVRDFVATIYHILGIGKEATVTDRSGRPHYVVAGNPVLGLL